MYHQQLDLIPRKYHQFTDTGPKTLLPYYLEKPLVSITHGAIPNYDFQWVKIFVNGIAPDSKELTELGFKYVSEGLYRYKGTLNNKSLYKKIAILREWAGKYGWEFRDQD